VFEFAFIDGNSRSQAPLLLTVDLVRRALTSSLIVILARLLNYENRSLRSSSTLLQITARLDNGKVVLAA